MTSSLFEPNSELLSKFQNLEELTRVVKSYPIDTVRLDDVPEARNADMLKIDVQGAELMVLRDAREMLLSVGIVISEVTFVPMYKDQALFGDIDAEMRAQGFLLHRLTSTGRTFKPLIFRNDINAPINQALWGDAVYVRDFMKFDSLDSKALLKLAVMLHETFHSCDLAAVALEAYDRMMGSRLQVAYIRGLASA